MIVDSFPFFDEYDLLEVRLTLLDPVVDRFVIVEGTRTFAGKPKPLRLLDAKERYAKWWHKIKYIKVDDWPDTDNAWILENHQRNAIARGWEDLSDEDVVIMSDLDEIPNPATVSRYSGMKGVKWLVQRDFRNFVNALNVKSPMWGGGPRMTTYGEFKRLGELKKFKYTRYGPREVNEGATAVKLRRMRNVTAVQNGGWHLSFLGGIDAIVRKIQAYSHQERNTPEFLDRKRLQHALDEGLSVSGARLMLCPLEEVGYPAEMLAAIRKYPYMVCPPQSVPVRRKLSLLRGWNALKCRLTRRYFEQRIRFLFARMGIYYGMNR